MIPLGYDAKRTETSAEGIAYNPGPFLLSRVLQVVPARR
jgi:hypothetical protein